jgi:hypothetical protein
MKQHALAIGAALLATAAALSFSGCAATCAATPDKLAALKRGMTLDEATGVMGCRGMAVLGNDRDRTEIVSYEWDGPERGRVSRTQLDFQDGRLLSYTSDSRGAW